MKALILALVLAVLIGILAGCGGNLNDNKSTPPPPRTVVTPSGLQYEELEAGTGTMPKPGDVVVVDYVTYLADQTKVDSTMDPGKSPAEFGLGSSQVVKGFEEGVATMRVGGKRRLTIIPSLAYGDEGNPPLVPPDATLLCYVELLRIKPMMVTSTGLRYLDLVQGMGAEAENGKTVSAKYTGWLTDGYQFDSNVNPPGDPFTFVLGEGEVIPGWDEGLLGMRVGGKRRLVIPPELGYGDTGAGSEVPPNSTLIFEVELVDVQD